MPESRRMSGPSASAIMLQQFQHNTNDYPTSDGRPMVETDAHRDIMVEAIALLKHWFAADRNTYVSGNLLLFYEEGNKRRHIAPDVFVVKGVPDLVRDNYLMWDEGKGPDVVIEITSKTTRSEDLTKKFDLYLNRLGVQEYFLFDPLEDYLKPSMQGFRRRAGEFRPIRALAGRMPSKVLGLHLERSGRKLRFWNPATGEWELTDSERILHEHRQTEAERARADALQRELDELRRRFPQS